nr:RES family NAD+ phosphorylase [uncultured Pedobacter sp.]
MKNRIEAASSIKGDCDFCGSLGVIIVKCEEVSLPFEQIFGLYINHPNAEKSLHDSKQYLLHEHLLRFWPKLFNTTLLTDLAVKQLVNQLGRGTSIYSVSLFEEPVEIEFLLGTEGMPAEDLELKWDSFSEEIKTRNRFFLSEKIDTEDLQSIFERLATIHPKGAKFYRARISDEKLRINKLGKPPLHLTTPGRANPVGIPYLYVSESEETTLYETRVALHESLTIGQFIAKETISLVSLRNIDWLGPIEIMDRGFTLEEFIRCRPYMIKLEQELSSPVRKQDVHLDYLPTQFLCEFIKSLGFDAVEYKSAMNIDGFNLAIFNDAKLECKGAKFVQVKDIKYSYS